MKHPHREEWVPFLYGESNAADQQRLSSHLDQCAECARELDGWRRSLAQLDAWPLPPGQSSTLSGLLGATVKWGMAAGLVLGIGILIGLLGRPASASLTEMRAEVENAVKASMEAELAAALDRIHEQTSQNLRAAEARLVNASFAERQRLWHALADALDTSRAEDARVVQAALRQAQERSEAQLIALRKDLETLAFATDEEIRQARLNLIQLASATTSINN